MKKVLAMILVAVMMLCVSAAAFADGQISLDQARQIALNYAGVNAAEATFTMAFQDWDNGCQVYEIEFWVGGTEYEMDVDVLTGRVMDYNIEYHGAYNSQPAFQPGYNDWDDWDDMYDHDWNDMYDRDWDDLFDWD